MALPAACMHAVQARVPQAAGKMTSHATLQAKMEGWRLMLRISRTVRWNKSFAQKSNVPPPWENLLDGGQNDVTRDLLSKQAQGRHFGSPQAARNGSIDVSTLIHASVAVKKIAVQTNNKLTALVLLHISPHFSCSAAKQSIAKHHFV